MSNSQVMCLRQFIRPEHVIDIPNVGNCSKCIPDKNNAVCKLYSPITVVVIEIEANDE